MPDVALFVNYKHATELAGAVFARIKLSAVTQVLFTSEFNSPVMSRK